MLLVDSSRMLYSLKRTFLEQGEGVKSNPVMSNIEENGLLKRLEEFLSKSKSSTTIAIEKNGVGGYVVTSNAKLVRIQGETLSATLEKFLQTVEAK
jgi:hypothetical protein